MILQVDIPNPPVIPGECFEPLKAEPQEMFGGSNTSSNDVCVYRGSDGSGGMGCAWERNCKKEIRILGTHRASQFFSCSMPNVGTLGRGVAKINIKY